MVQIQIPTMTEKTKKVYCDRCGQVIRKSLKINGKIYGLVCAKHVIFEATKKDGQNVND